MISRRSAIDRLSEPLGARHGSRWVLLLMPFCVGTSSCASDPGDLFPAPRFTPPSTASTSPDGLSAAPADAPGASEPATTVTEAPPAAAELGRESPAPANGGAAGGSGMPVAMPGDDAMGVPPGADPADPAAGDPGAGDPGAAIPEEDPTGGARICPPIAEPLLLDFEATDGTTQALFGNFQNTLSGGTYFYPAAPPAAADETPPLGLSSDVTAGDWHVSGSIAQTAGFGIFLECQLLDASRFVGLAFRVAGSIEGADSFTFKVTTAANEVSRAWLLANNGSTAPSFGRCLPELTQFDGTCDGSRFEVALSAEPRDVVVLFSALRDGSPEVGVNPAEITKIAWLLPVPVADASGSVEPSAVDLRIDDIRFVAAD